MAPHLFVEPKAIASIALARDNYLNTDLKQRLARYHDDVDSAFWGWNDIWLQPPFAQWNIEAEIAGIAAPLLAMQGVDDEYGTLDQMQVLVRHVPRTELLELPACGHSPQRDQPARVIEAATRFINTHLDSPSPRPANQPAA
jgi:pimeloyl-ACP methyl ester carboxylesterase